MISSEIVKSQNSCRQLLNFSGRRDSRGAKEGKSDRSRKELPTRILVIYFIIWIYVPFYNEYLVAKFGFDKTENESNKVCQKLVSQ